MPRTGGHRSAAAALVTLALLVVPTACSDNSTQGQSSPSATAAPAPGTPTMDCRAVSALQSSLNDLMNVKPLQDGLTALRAAMADVKSSLRGAAAAASAALQPAVEGVRAAFSQLETSVSGLSADTFRQKAPEINSALQQVGTAASTFATTLTQSCPSG